jgi:hypothetical protein
MFRVELGVTRDEMLDMTVPEMVDLLDYYKEIRRG